jgi:biotin carboxyl carrier protein
MKRRFEPLNGNENIPTPMKLQWRRVRYQLIPMVSFLICAIITGILWKRHVAGPNVMGEVAAINATVTAPIDGALMPIPRRTAEIEVFEHVSKDQVIAVFDTASLLASSKAHDRELARLVESKREKQEQLLALSKGGTTTQPASADVLKNEIKALDQLIANQRDILSDIDVKMANCIVKAPYSGTVTAIHARPGQHLRQGREIMTITAEGGTHIVTYVRPGSSIRPQKDMVVDIRTQDRRIARSRVTEVGAQVERVPDHQLSNPRFPEWGVPVRIAMPTAVDLKPGELVGLIYRPGEQQ